MVHTLDTLLQGTESEEIVHTAAMLAFIEAAHEVVNRTTMPTPLYSLHYDRSAHTLSFEVLDGKACAPKEGATYVNMLDLLLASLFRDKMPLNLEGITGIGKTYTVEQFLKAILPSDSYRVLRLNATMSNVLQPYTEGKVEGGLVKISLRKEELNRIAALFIDEVNRGDTNQVLMLQDGVLRLPTGESGYLGLPIPRRKDGRWEMDYETKRPVFVVSAQNPSITKDAKYTGARRTDAAQSNRNVTIDAPNTALSIGASALLLGSENGQHKEFLQNFRRNISRNLGIEERVLDQLETDWLPVYAYTTDPSRTQNPIMHSAVEFMDAMLVMVSPELKKTFDYEKEISKAWQDQLGAKYNISVAYDGTLTETAISLQMIRDIVESFQEEIIPRDIIKVKKLADTISLTRRTKQALQSANPTQAYLRIANYITLEDISCAFAIMLHDKQEKHEQDPVLLISTMLKEYIKVSKIFAGKVGYNQVFNPEDSKYSIGNLAFQHAIQGMGNNGIPAFVKDIGTSIKELGRLEAGNEYRKPLLARQIADLSTLAGFADQYTTALHTALQGDISQRTSAFKTFFQNKRKSVGIPDIYIHRLTRTLGV